MSSTNTQARTRPTNPTWIATGLAFPSFPLRTALKDQGIPDWAIRLDLLGIMLPDNSYTIRVNGVWECRTVGTQSTPMSCTSEADAKAIKLLHLIATGQIQAAEAIGRLEQVLAA